MFKSHTLVTFFRATLAVLFLSGCSAFQPPTRPSYQGIDNVSVATSEQVVGTWRVTELNPFPQTTPQTTTIEYKANGTVIGFVKPFEGDSELPADFTLTLTGDWTLDGDVVVHNNMIMTGPDDSDFSQLVAETLNDQPKIESRANILEMEPDRMIMIGRDGTAMEYRRQ